jgi:hypothetical protein
MKREIAQECDAQSFENIKREDEMIRVLINEVDMLSQLVVPSARGFAVSPATEMEMMIPNSKNLICKLRSSYIRPSPVIPVLHTITAVQSPR